MATQNEPIDLSEDFKGLRIYYAFVCQGDLDDFQAVKEDIENLENSRLVYMKKSMGRLYVSDRNPFNSPLARWNQDIE